MRNSVLQFQFDREHHVWRAPSVGAKAAGYGNMFMEIVVDTPGRWGDECHLDEGCFLTNLAGTKVLDWGGQPECFPTFAEAKAWCQTAEDRMLAESAAA